MNQWSREYINLDVKAKAGSELDAKHFAEAINDHVASKSRGVHYMKKVSFAPSGVGYRHGHCPRYWTIAFAGAEFDDTADTLAIENMENGTYSHERIGDLLDDAGVVITIELEVTTQDPPIRGFIDILAGWENQESFPVEFKTAKQEVYWPIKTSNKGVSYHVVQLLIYMRLLGKQDGILLYENKNDNQLHAIPIHMGERYSKYVDEMFEWMRQVRAVADEEKYAKVPWKNGLKHANCKWCPLKKVCPTVGDETDVSLPPLKVLVT